MAQPGEHYTSKGRREAVGALLEQGHVSLEVARERAEPLAAYGFGAARHAELAAALDRVQRLVGVQSTREAERAARLRAEHQALADAKAAIGHLREALPMALRDAAGEAPELSAFHVGGRLHRSSGKVAGYLVRIAKLVERVDEPLRPYFRGQRASEVLAAAEAALTAANAAQEYARKRRLEETRALWEAKGRLLEAIEDLNRVARIAFAEEPLVARRFNKDLLERARRAGRRRAQGRAQEAEAGPEAEASGGPSPDAKGPDGAGPSD